MGSKVFISVIIPCYNEGENIKRGVLEEVFAFLKKQKIAWEVVISDDGSTDDSRKLLKEKLKKFENFFLVENPHGGKPSALLGGVKKARGDYVLFTDMDQSTPISEIRKLLPYAKDGFDAVIGSRGLFREDFPIYRKIGAFVFMNFRRALILPEIVDTQCGFKLFKKKIVRDLLPNLEFFREKKERSGWIVTSYDVELLHLVKKSGGRIAEVPVLWNDRDKSKAKGMGLSKYIKESKEMFFQILRVKLNDLRGFYN